MLQIGFRVREVDELMDCSFALVAKGTDMVLAVQHGVLTPAQIDELDRIMQGAAVAAAEARRRHDLALTS